MARTRSPLLGTSVGAANLDRCVNILNWINRRLHRDRVTDGTFVPNGIEVEILQGEPFIALPVLDAMGNLGSNGVIAACTQAARERIRREFALLRTEWRTILADRTAAGTQSGLKDLLRRTDLWLDAMLHPIERKRLQAYLRQLRHSHGRRAAGRVHRPVQLRIPRSIYDLACSGVPRGKRAEFISRLLEWASTCQEARATALAAVGIPQDSRIANPGLTMRSLDSQESGER